jgi:hypothetical protein
LVTDAARSFIREQPPSRPCIAEYGESFPRHPGEHPGTASLPYLSQFAELEWHLGCLALATEASPHVHYLHVDWSLDELIGVYLSNSAPDVFAAARRRLAGDQRPPRITRHASPGTGRLPSTGQ